jgi:hypothetical protein
MNEYGDTKPVVHAVRCTYPQCQATNGCVGACSKEQLKNYNERIKELAIQSGLNAPYGSDHEGLRDFDYRKFAELIVQECADLCSITASGRDAEAIEEAILKHFGIKE